MLMADRQYAVTPDSVTVHLDDRMFVIDRDHPNFKTARAAIMAEDWENVRRAMDIPATIFKHSEGDIQFLAGILRYKDEKINNAIASRILDLIQVNSNFKPLMRLLDRVMTADATRCHPDPLYLFLCENQLPITPEGRFLAYRRIEANTYSPDRAADVLADDGEMKADPENPHAFHVGSREYAQSLGPRGHVAIVEIDPADIVHVPAEEDAQAIKVARFRYVGVIY